MLMLSLQLMKVLLDHLAQQHLAKLHSVEKTH